MRDALKIAFLVVLLVTVSAAFFFLAGNSVARGYVVVGRGEGSAIYTYAESPVMFSLAVGIMIAFATFMLAGAVSFVFAGRASRKQLLSLTNGRVFRVRASIRWALALSAVILILVALVIAPIFRAWSAA